ncbi:MAG: GTPase ObgE [Synergistaceae bacterium]|nr:GTPase ObgE [Synergistaceae bacterium]
MKFLDLARIAVKAGRGGNGSLSFRREKFLPKGGADGGDGGRGGDVVLEAVHGVVTLADFEYDRRFQAENGGHGSGARSTGRSGDDLVVRLPRGTVVRDADTGALLADMADVGTFVAAKGGRGGRGNARFVTSSRQAPRFAEKGDEGEARTLLLELKLIADVGLVGLPNAGKSSILAAISGASPKIADYPFTTLSPNLGVLSVDDERVVIADVPGLVEGASENKGLGHHFLRHVERTRVLVHVVDLSLPDPVAAWETVRREFEAYGRGLESRSCLVVGNKIDLLGTEENGVLLSEAAGRLGMRCMLTSAARGDGIPELVRVIADMVRAAAKPVPREEHVPLPQAVRRSRKGVEVVRLSDPDSLLRGNAPAKWRVCHAGLEKAVARIDFEQDDALQRFARILSRLRVEEALSQAGASDGDKVYIGEVEFDFQPDRIS